MGGYGGNQQITMPSRSVPAEPKILVSNHNAEGGNAVPEDVMSNSPYGDRYELKWKVPNDNGDPIDHYVIRYCMVSPIFSIKFIIIFKQ